ncbi:MAG: peptidoglycan editing factor PgeF [Thermoanaerobacteraceae bacterium]
MDIGFKRNEKENMVFYTISSFEKTGIVNHLFTTRIGGVSKGQYSSLNLSLKRFNNKEEVYNNFKRVCNIGNFSYENMVFSDQVHGNFVRKVTYEDRGKNFGGSDIIEVDGLMTNERGIPLVTFYADCVPLFFLDPVKKVIALAHAGWRGTVSFIGPKTVNAMEKEYGSNTKDILVGIGPSIYKCCYEVGEDVANKIKGVIDDWEKVLVKKSDEKWMLDLQQTNYIELINTGIPDENITLSQMCTHCNSEFYSYRRDKGITGSMAAFMELK